uniref:ATP synthase complex subunit 8 n=1 Tax=Leptodius sanguineus TaxID=903667 RepID=A0A140GMC2_9EUCA|nr:ATP synthase F0 subunit 8 [Leptodius sanguineus]AMN14558.1 ATP synthase F0 subunit 8 [Leptodius sanguineus]
MPQMAPLFWLCLYVFFLISLTLFIILNFFIKPFESNTTSSLLPSPNQKIWKL